MGKRGGMRPGAGRPRKSTAEHVLAGSFRADRHGPRPAHVHALVAPTADMDWRPSPEDVAALGDLAQAWLAAVLATWRFDSEIEGRRLLLALESLDRADQLKRALQAEGVGANAGLHRALDRELRQFAAQWAELRLGRV